MVAICCGVEPASDLHGSAAYRRALTREVVRRALVRLAETPVNDRTPVPGEGERLRDLFAPPFARISEYRVARVVTCAYTFTKDETFFAAERGRALVVSACSGHGYKFGAAVGIRTAEALESGEFGSYLRWINAEAARSIAA